jgi:hypothetical protein
MLFLDSRQARDSPLSALYGNLRSILKGPVECLNFLRGGAYHLGRGERRTSITNRRRVRERERRKREKMKKHGVCSERNLGFVLFPPFFCFTPLFVNFPLLSSPRPFLSLSHSFFCYTHIHIYIHTNFFLSFLLYSLLLYH